MAGYVTVTEADEYIATHYLSTDELRLSWESLDYSDKEVMLTVSAEAIDSLPWPGRKLDPRQPNAFPRYPHREVPMDIMFAQIENALSQADSTTVEDANLYQKMWAYGISSYRIGNLSETVGTASGNASARSKMAENGIVSLKAQTLLTRYMGGGYCIE